MFLCNVSLQCFIVMIYCNDLLQGFIVMFLRYLHLYNTMTLPPGMPQGITTFLCLYPQCNLDEIKDTLTSKVHWALDLHGLANRCLSYNNL